METSRRVPGIDGEIVRAPGLSDEATMAQARVPKSKYRRLEEDWGSSWEEGGGEKQVCPPQ